MDDILFTGLYRAFNDHQPCGHHRAALSFHIARPQQNVDDAAFVLDSDKDRITFTGALADKDDTCSAHAGAVFACDCLRTTHYALRGKACTQEGKRMGFQGQPRHLIIRQYFFDEWHCGEHRVSLAPKLGYAHRSKKRELCARCASCVPQGLAPSFTKRPKRIGIRELAQRCGWQHSVVRERLN